MNDDMDLGWRLYLDDEMSAALDRVEGAWGRTVAGVNSGGSRVVRVVAEVEDRMISAARSFTAWASRGVRQFGGAVAALVGQSGALGMLLGGPVGIATMMHRVVSSSMEAGGEIENLQLAFTTLMHSSDGARAHLAELQQFAVGKPFEFSYLATSSRTLQSFGYTARDTMGMLRDFGDVAAGSGVGTQGFDTMVRIAGQIRTMGRMTRGHISQLGAVGLDVNRILRDQLHLSEAQIANIAHAGIDRERLIQGLREGMRLQWGGGMERASATLTAKLSDLSDTLGNLRRMIYESLGPVLIPLVDAFASFLTQNAKRIASAFTLLFAVVVHVIQAIVGPVFGAFSDAMSRARDDSRSGLSDIGRRFQRFALIIEGVAALISGDNGRGFSRISQSLKDRLDAAGLWPFVVRLARLASLVRAMLRGIFGAVADAAGGRLATVSRFFNAFTGGADNMEIARATAERFGRTIVRVVMAFLAFQGAMRVGRFVLENLERIQMAASAVRTAFTFLAAHPLILALIVVGVLLFALYRHFRGNVEVMGRLRAAWDSLKSALAPVAAAISDIWEMMKGTASNIADSMMRAGISILNALRPAFPVIRLIASALAVIGYLSFLVFAKVLQGAISVALVPLVFLARAIGALVTITFPYIRAAIGWVGRQIMSVAAVALPMLYAGIGAVARFFIGAFVALRPTLMSVWQMLRVGASIIMVVLYVAFLAVSAVARRVFASVWGAAVRAYNGLAIIFTGLKTVFREAFSFLEPFVGPIFNAIAETARTVFGGVIDTLLGGLRTMASALVRVFEGLPPSLRPAALSGAIQNLRAFSSGKGLTVNDAKTAAIEAAPAPDTNTEGRASVNRSRSSPARAANEVRELRRDHVGLAMQAMAAPPITVVPSNVVVQVDGRTLATATQRQQESERIRAGGVLPAR